MKVNIAPIMEQKGASLDFNLETKCPPLELQQQEVTCIEPLRLAFTLTNTGVHFAPGQAGDSAAINMRSLFAANGCAGHGALSEEFYRAKKASLTRREQPPGTVSMKKMTIQTTGTPVTPSILVRS